MYLVVFLTTSKAFFLVSRHCEGVRSGIHVSEREERRDAFIKQEEQLFQFIIPIARSCDRGCSVAFRYITKRHITPETLNDL